MAEFLVPMKFTITGDALVTADTPEEAAEKAKRGRWDSYDVSIGETTNWEVCGDAELNE